MMLAELERKTAALIADHMAPRTHLSVIAAPGPPSPTDDGREVAVVSIAEASTDGEFQAERFVSQTSPAQSRRVLPLSIVAGIDFAIRPADPAGHDHRPCNAVRLHSEPQFDQPVFPQIGAKKLDLAPWSGIVQ